MKMAPSIRGAWPRINRVVMAAMARPASDSRIWAGIRRAPIFRSDDQIPQRESVTRPAQHLDDVA